MILHYAHIVESAGIIKKSKNFKIVLDTIYRHMIYSVHDITDGDISPGEIKGGKHYEDNY